MCYLETPVYSGIHDKALKFQAETGRARYERVTPGAMVKTDFPALESFLADIRNTLKEKTLLASHRKDDNGNIVTESIDRGTEGLYCITTGVFSDEPGAGPSDDWAIALFSINRKHRRSLLLYSGGSQLCSPESNTLNVLEDALPADHDERFTREKTEAFLKAVGDNVHWDKHRGWNGFAANDATLTQKALREQKAAQNIQNYMGKLLQDVPVVS